MVAERLNMTAMILGIDRGERTTVLPESDRPAKTGEIVAQEGEISLLKIVCSSLLDHETNSYRGTYRKRPSPTCVGDAQFVQLAQLGENASST